MTSTQKPNVIIFNGINFNPSFYSSESSLYLTQQGALGSFLSYPIAQGTETMQDTNINGILSINGIEQYKNANNVLIFKNPNNNPSGYIFTMPNTVGINPNQLIIYPAGIQINNNLQLNGWPLSLDSVNNVGITLDNTYTRFNLVNASSLFRFTTSISTTPIIDITPSLITFNNPTSINNLTSTTQPNGTNDTSVATTAFVHNSISSVTPMPYLWAYGQKTTNAPFGNLSLNFTGSSWAQNAFFSIRFIFQAEWSCPAVALDQYYYIYSGVMNIYPNRIITNNTGNCLLNGSLNGNLNYFISPTDTINAPNGRWFWVENYSNSQSINTGFSVTNPIYITTVNQSSLSFSINAPFPTTGQYIQTCNIEILSQGPAGLSITSSGVTNFQNYNNTF